MGANFDGVCINDFGIFQLGDPVKIQEKFIGYFGGRIRKELGAIHLKLYTKLNKEKNSKKSIFYDMWRFTDTGIEKLDVLSGEDILNDKEYKKFSGAINN